MRDVSQRALGAMLGMTKKNGSVRINRYEQQTSRADMDTAAEIAAALEVPLASLFSDSEGMAELICVYAKLEKSQQLQLLSEAKRLLSADRTGGME